jgi:hypothetical protein
LVFSAGVFHHEGWAAGAIDLDAETEAFFLDYWGYHGPAPATEESTSGS